MGQTEWDCSHCGRFQLDVCRARPEGARSAITFACPEDAKRKLFVQRKQ